MSCHRKGLSKKQAKNKYASRHVCTCRFSNGDAVPQELWHKCPKSKPSTTVRCPRCAFCEDFAQHRDCSAHGVCMDNTCVCEAGWAGSICDQKSARCRTGVVDAARKCCDSALVGNGRCCSGANAKLDGNGDCCQSGAVDVCGKCDGKGRVVDAAGTCCSVGPAF
jgi:hypothetical protein